MFPLPGHQVPPKLQSLLAPYAAVGADARSGRGSTPATTRGAASAAAAAPRHGGGASLGSWILGSLLLAACAGGATPATKPVATTASPAIERPNVAPLPPPQAPGGYGPEILLPKQDAPDAEVGRVGDLVLRQSHAWTRLLSAQPKLALEAVDLLVFDVLVARHAQQFGVRVTPERVEELAGAEEKQARQQVATELGGQTSFADYLWRLFGMREGDWQATLRLRTAQRLYQGYVIRYLALRENRVQVRYLVHKDEKVAREVADKTRAGADFATLAMRHSEDASRREGGLLPPFGEGFQHPVAVTAFTLQKGEVSAPFQARWGDEQRWFVVYCLDRLPGRDVPFAEVAAEIDGDLAKNPISQLERSAYVLRWRTDTPPRSDR